MGAKIINRGRGPEIEGTRITVYDVLDYARQGWHRDRIAALFRLSSRDIQAALDYIEQHQEEVATHYQTILDRQKPYQYPPEVAAKIAASRQRVQARLAAMKSARPEKMSSRTMARIMADHNIEGHFVVLLRMWTSVSWRTVWESLALEVESFERLGIPYDTSDCELWQLCQRHETVLITANRHDEGPESLESAIRDLNEPLSLPVITIADPGSVLANRDYAERVAIQVLEYFLALDNLCGVGRLFVP